MGALNRSTRDVTPGTVAYFGAATPPAGWLECNGAAISRTAYAGLFAAIGTAHGVGDGATTFNLPDLRGEFIRGLDSGRGVDTGRVLGSSQAHAFQSHSHSSLIDSLNGTDATRTNSQKGNGNTVWTLPTQSAGAASETRPRNIALLPCMKY